MSHRFVRAGVTGIVPVQSVAPSPLTIVGDDVFPEIDGTSPGIASLKAHMRLVARDALVTALIVGETGTGKERVARAIHRASRRSISPLVVVNCAGLSATLIEDELFGHVRGAFTGASSDRPGPFELADGGTVFLDEIGELPRELQVKLLRILQQRTVVRLGATRETPFDVQVLVATIVALDRATAHGQFREDLYHRLKVYELVVPPLRSRGRSDLRALASALLTRLTERRRASGATLAPALLDLFSSYSWPGNVRELENTLERMLVAAGGGSWLLPGHLPVGFGALFGERAPIRQGVRNNPPTVDEALSTLTRRAGNRRQTARDLGLSRHQLYRLLQRASHEGNHRAD